MSNTHSPSKNGVANGKARKEVTVEELRRAIPASLFKRSESRFLVSVFQSAALTYALYYIGQKYIPLELYALPVWIAYAFITGTVATGLWVLGHECGHGAFSESKLLNDLLGYVLHTALLVPYFSWQWSHHVHHSKCNHLTLGESHVPQCQTPGKKNIYVKIREIIGVESFSFFQIFNIAFLGWPLYLLIGATGGPARGFTSHFIVPNKLFPMDKMLNVQISNAGLIFMFYLLYKWVQATSFAHVAALFGGPYLIVNCYLTIITFLQHTEKDVPHYDESAWTWLKGALATIDRNYPKWIDALQYQIGTTHVVHHLFHELPHYNAKEANVYVKQVLGDLYKSDDRPIHSALFECAKLACVEHQGDGQWTFI